MNSPLDFLRTPCKHYIGEATLKKIYVNVNIIWINHGFSSHLTQDVLFQLEAFQIQCKIKYGTADIISMSIFLLRERTTSNHQKILTLTLSFMTLQRS